MHLSVLVLLVWNAGDGDKLLLPGNEDAINLSLTRRNIFEYCRILNYTEWNLIKGCGKSMHTGIR